MGFDQDVIQCVPSTFHMISSSADAQQSEESHNTGAFELPNPAGKAGGACTSCFLQQQYGPGNIEQSWVETLQQMRSVLKGMGYDQTPQLTSSRPIRGADAPMQIVPPGSGRRRALLIGINYVGQKGALTACHNDCNNIKEYLVQVHGFREEEMLVLMDDGRHPLPTKANIENGFVLLTKYSQPGDVAFVSFSGHGGNTVDLSGDEDDGMDETLIPVDFQTEGHIVDDDILDMLVKPMKAGVTVTVLMDCCHSGTVLDLPYAMGADDRNSRREAGFDMKIVRDSVRPKKPTAEEAKLAKKKRDREKKKQEKELAKAEELRAEGEDKAAAAAAEVPVGPKLAPNGQPVLPTRPAQQRSPDAAVEGGGKKGRKDKDKKQGPKTPPKQCTVM